MFKSRKRLVVVTRRTAYEESILRDGTAEQAQFMGVAAAREMKRLVIDRKRAKTRQPNIIAAAVEETSADRADASKANSAIREAHDREQKARDQVIAAAGQRPVTRLDRDQLSRFFFQPDDIIVAVGQDGLVANVAKYLKSQFLLGINPDPGRFDGVLCRLKPMHAAQAINWVDEGGGQGFLVEQRCMALARREDGQELTALNDLFIGHRSHQSARYRIEVSGAAERHSSSGVLCSTGTGATGWARSIMLQRGITQQIPDPCEKRLLWFVREPFLSVWTQTKLTVGQLGEFDELLLTSEMGAGGVIFADGMEDDFLDFNEGQSVLIHVSERRLNLVTYSH